MKQLIIKALIRYISGLVLISSLLFIPSGSLKFWNGWLFIGILFIPMLFVMTWLVIFDPELMAKRLNTKEKEQEQKLVVFLSAVVILSSFIISGLDFRYNWSQTPLSLEIFSALMVLSGYILFFIVIKQNSYASRVVEIQDKQKLIDTGVYAVVRHPMYTAAVMIFVFMPLLLGSFYALIPSLFFPLQIAYRIKNEEEILEKGLEGYMQYEQKVKYRVIPFIW